PGQLEHRELVCGIGLSPDSERVIRYASETAKAVRGNLTLVHVIPASAPDPPLQLDLEEHLESAKRDGASRRIAARQGAAGSQSGAIGRLRDLTYALVRGAPCPVLSV